MKPDQVGPLSSATLRTIQDNARIIPQEVLDTLAHLVRDLRFGSIEIVVHEGRITQIERREKLRFSAAGQQRSD